MTSILTNQSRALTLAGLVAAGIVLAKLAEVIYSVYFHPLRKIPGPWWAAASRIPYARALVAGKTLDFLAPLHAKYGPVVRYSPNEISVTDGENAWQEVYGFRTGKQRGVGAFEKDRTWYAPGIDNVDNILIAKEGPHGRQRRIFSHAFSERALRDQEWLLQKYANMLVSRIKETDVAAGRPANMEQWFTWTTFDVISDLTFGEPFGCLAKAETHKYVKLLMGAFQALGIFYCLTYWPWLGRLKNLVIDNAAIARRMEWLDFVKTSTVKRMKSDVDRHDFMADVLAKRTEEEAKGNDTVSDQEIISTSNILLVAGTDTTATTLQAATYYMLTNPEVYRKVVEEVRGRFKSDEDISIEGVMGLTYTIAVLTEALRCMPPVPAGFLRKVPESGAMVSGYWLDGNCNASISLTHHTSYRDEHNFRDANSFVPERWLGGEKYKDDNRATFQPFSFGPRNCLGRNLAYAEMRLLMAKMVFNFDMRLDPASKGFVDRSKVVTLWWKPELLVHLTPVA